LETDGVPSPLLLTGTTVKLYVQFDCRGNLIWYSFVTHHGLLVSQVEIKAVLLEVALFKAVISNSGKTFSLIIFWVSKVWSVQVAFITSSIW